MIVSVKCSCGVTVRVERDECGASAPVVPCVCGKAACLHQVIECSDCGLPTRECCRGTLGGRVLCASCLAAEAAAGAEELAEVQAHV